MLASVLQRRQGAEEVAKATATIVSFLFFSILLRDTKKQKTYDRSGRLRDFFAWIDADFSVLDFSFLWFEYNMDRS